MTSKKTIKSAFESMMFVWGEPLDVRTAAEVFNIDWKEAYSYFQELQQEYLDQERGIEIREIDHKFQFCTKLENNDYIERLCSPAKEKRLSQSALEVLAIIAYKQPVTKGEIESIRGIKCDRVLEGLGKKSLVGEVGRSGGIGRPILYGTTPDFLKYFSFKDLSDLPDIEDIEAALQQDDDIEQLNSQQISINYVESDKQN